MRNLAKVNDRIHTDAIQRNLIPAALTSKQVSHVYASEADVLNMALFAMTAKEWRQANLGVKGNVRDQANGAQLVCLANLENLNALFISEGIDQATRLTRLNQIAISQMQLLTDEPSIQRLEDIQPHAIAFRGNASDTWLRSARHRRFQLERLL